MCQQGESHVVSILTLIYFQSTTNRSWPTNVCCDAAQICPTPGFEHVCAVCCCVWGPALCKRGVRKHCFCKVSALRWGWCLCYLFPVAPARSPCVFFVSCLLVAVGRSGLVRATKLVKSTEISHTFPAYIQCILIIPCICIFWSTPLLPQVNLVHPWACLGLVRATKLVNRQRFPTPPGAFSIYYLYTMY